ncbi:MAG: hypothetical protein H7X79_06085 [Sporomusaceae bacterium]|nr:hypothetical protein [Sporomusaceae bacterium]
MNEEILRKVLNKLESIDNRLKSLEVSTTTELQKLHATLDILGADQQEEVIMTLHRIDVKMTAILEAQKLNVEILRVFSGDLVQH